ncbi:MAG: hypothetical protein ISS36_01470 [Candidatus Aenigmarchaeota archaeon]|nr:hypothetical protein [Candidatus Aenigmarchaeota archaeon]
MKLDLFELCLAKDNIDTRSWILVSGSDLNKIFMELKNEILSKINEIELINKILFNLNICIELVKYENPRKLLKSWIKKQKPSGFDIASFTGTSYGDWKKIETGKHLPSCQKIRKISILFGSPSGFRHKCKNNDFCFRALVCIFSSLNINKKFIPLNIILEILKIWKCIFNKSEFEFNQKKLDIMKNIDWLKMNQHRSRSIKAVKNIDKNLSKIIGAFAADGNFYPPDMIRWEEEYEDNMIALSRWLYYSFGIVIKVKKSNRERNSHVFRFRNKIISRYLEIFFNFKPKAKTYSVDEPDCIKKSSLDIRRGFAKGALMFESGVNTDFNITLHVRSKKFRDSLVNIIKTDTDVKKYIVKVSTDLEYLYLRIKTINYC